MRVMIFALLGMLCLACHDGCKSAETRCQGSVVEICADDQDWMRVVDCGEVGIGWVCCDRLTADGDELIAGCATAQEDCR